MLLKYTYISVRISKWKLKILLKTIKTIELYERVRDLSLLTNNFYRDVVEDIKNSNHFLVNWKKNWIQIIKNWKRFISHQRFNYINELLKCIEFNSATK